MILLPINLSTEESIYVSLLKDKRLLCELPFERDYIENLRQVLFQMGNQAWDYPTLASIMTVGLGIYYYNHGEFWDVFSFLSTPAAQSSWGQRFEDFISRHSSLEEFRSLKDEHALRYVGLILAHGSIPQSCLSDFFALITHEADIEQSGQEVIDDLKRSRILGPVDKPVQRFLKYGGEVAEEFVTRFLALWQCYDRGDMSAKCGLPNRVVEAFSEWWPEHRPKQRNNYKRIPRPELHIEPSGQGVYLSLPRCDTNPNIDPQARWHVLGKDWAVTRTHEVQVTPSESWMITGVGPTYTLEGVTDNFPGLFFDPNSGRVISEPSLRRLPDKVWTLFKGHLQSEPLPSFEEEFTQWPGYYLAIFDLSDRKKLCIANHIFDVRRPFFHCDSDPIVPGVHNQDGTSVFCAVPVIRWEGKANLTLVKDGKPQGNINIESDELFVLLDKPGDYLVELRGPLGENIHKHFVLIPGLVVQPNPQILWPNQDIISWNLSAKDGSIKSGGNPPPYTHSGSSMEFKIEYVDYEIELCAEVPRLQWRMLPQQDNQMTEWFCEPISTWVNDLFQSNYPLLECTLLADNQASCFSEMDVNVFLVGQHSPIKLEAKRKRTGVQNSWYFDLRCVRDEIEAGGKSDNFNLLIQSREGAIHFSGQVLSVKSRWNLQNFHAEWKKEKDQHIIDVSWHESGKTVTDRWLVVISIWRPWENAILQYHFSDNERSGHTWQLPISDVYPGRYIVKAVHAPWGCDDWIGAKAVSEQAIDVYKEKWPETFNQCHADSTVDFYLQALLAHWYRPQLVQPPLPTPSGLTVDGIKRFLDGLRIASVLEHEHIPRNGSGLHNIFITNPTATTEAYLSSPEQSLVGICSRVFPNPEVITLELEEYDKYFIRDVAYHYTDKNRLGAAKDIKLHSKKRALSGVLATWHKNLNEKFPPLYDVIFLCEKFQIFAEQSPAKKYVYEELKSKYQRGETI